MKKYSPKVSIVIPAYNSSKYIGRCMESILEQTYKDYEVIIIDDGSSDDTLRVCNRIAEKDERISVLHTENYGAGAARKTGVSMAKGEWVMFVDSDDTVTVNGLFLLLSFVDESVDVVCGAFVKDGMIFGHKQEGLLSNVTYIETLLVGGTTEGPVCKLFRRSVFEDLPWMTTGAITINEDLLMLVAIATKSKGIYLSSDVICYNYITRKGSASTRPMKFSSWVNLFEEIENLIAPFREHDSIEKAFIYYRLKRLDWHIHYSREQFDTNNPYIIQLINDCENLDLDKKNSQIVKNLRSKSKRRLIYWIQKMKLYRVGILFSMFLKR